MADIQNANPTILRPEDLPTRRRRTSSASSQASPLNEQDAYHSSFLFSDPINPYLDPFSDAPPSPSISASGLEPSSSSSSSSSPPHKPYPSTATTTTPAPPREEIDAQEIYDLISSISDPEHPLTLGSLAVVNLPDISIAPFSTRPGTERLRTVTVLITPTITHCSMATIIGLGVRVRLEQCLPARYRVDVRIKKGTHSDAGPVSKQLADKERVAAAMENASLRGMLNTMFKTCV